MADAGAHAPSSSARRALRGGRHRGDPRAPPTATSSCAAVRDALRRRRRRSSTATRRRGWPSSAPRARCAEPLDGTVAVVDVGGGSTEIAVGTRRRRRDAGRRSLPRRLGLAGRRLPALATRRRARELARRRASTSAGRSRASTSPPAELARRRRRQRHLAAPARRRACSSRETLERGAAACSPARRSPSVARRFDARRPSACALLPAGILCSRRPRAGWAAAADRLRRAARGRASSS